MIRVHIIGKILLNGVGIGQRAVTGKVCVVRSIEDIKQKMQPGDILVIAGVDEETAVYAAKAGAIITEEGGLTSNAAVVSITTGIPAVIGVDKAVTSLTDGLIVTVDAARGLIYQGEINAR